MIQYTVFYDALGHKEAVHEEKHFADYLKLVALTHEKKRRRPRGGMDNKKWRENTVMADPHKH